MLDLDRCAETPFGCLLGRLAYQVRHRFDRGEVASETAIHILVLKTRVKGRHGGVLSTIESTVHADSGRQVAFNLWRPSVCALLAH